MIKNYEETGILIKVILDEYQIDILDLIKKQTIDIPKNVEDLKVKDFELFENRTLKSVEEKNNKLGTSINKLFENFNTEKKLIKKKPIININENFIRLIRKIR